jgi:hypothetical protein
VSVKTYVVDRRTHPPSPWAEFELEGDVVIATYFSGSFQKELDSGIAYSAKHGRSFRPEDGPIFLEALKKQYANATFIDVYEE